MALFKKDNDKQPDPPPADDDANGTTPTDDTAPQYITMEQFNTQISPLRDTLVTVSETLKTLNERQAQPYQPTPSAPPEDPHKDQKERIAAIDAQLEELSNKADDANYQGKGMGELMKRQNQLMTERADLQGQIFSSQRDPRLDLGFQTLDQLSAEVTSTKMPHLSIPEVKKRYDHYISTLPAEQRMMPETKMGAYNIAVGECLNVIQDAQKQAWLREAEEGDTATQVQATGASTGRDAKSKAGPPKPEDYLSAEALRSIKRSHHRTPDRYYQSLGYEGWDDYYAKNSEYLEEEGEE